MNINLKIELLKVFTLEFSMSSEKKEPEQQEETEDEEATKPHPGGIQ